jgi:hypothetical protein
MAPPGDLGEGPPSPSSAAIPAASMGDFPAAPKGLSRGVRDLKALEGRE